MKNGPLPNDPPVLDREILISFQEHLRSHGYSKIVVYRYDLFLRRVDGWLRRRDRRLIDLDISEAGPVLGYLLRGRRSSTVSQCRCSLACWFAFRELRPPQVKDRQPLWQKWCDDYRSFLTNHRGLQPETVEDNIREARLLLGAFFGRGEARWTTITVERIWRYCGGCTHGAKPSYINKRLFTVRRFLQFVHACGACPAQLFHAVPHVASFAVVTTPPATLTDSQRQQLLKAFCLDSPSGRRDLAMCRCMLDLGLRSMEVALLRLCHFDWSRRILTIPAVKRGRERRMPIPADVAFVLCDYLEGGRPHAATDFFFVRTYNRIGLPLTAMAVQASMARAYRRAGLPRSWHGSHRLRHTFATRLFAHGATLKEIADLLGHRRLDSANLYTRVDLTLLRHVALPWPV